MEEQTAVMIGNKIAGAGDRLGEMIKVRLAEENDLERINELRRQVNDLHAAGKPEIFKAGFSAELQALVRRILEDPEQEIAVAEREGVICGFAVLHHVHRPENPFMKERDFLDIDEFGVDEAFRRQGIGTAMIAYIREYAAKKGFHRIELNMWEFNRGALAFYEAAGFAVYRRYLEMRP